MNVANKFDIFVDYAEDESGRADRCVARLIVPYSLWVIRTAGAAGRVSDAGKLFDERWCRHRSVTDIAFSPKVRLLVF